MSWWPYGSLIGLIGQTKTPRPVASRASTGPIIIG